MLRQGSRSLQGVVPDHFWVSLCLLAVSSNTAGCRHVPVSARQQLTAHRLQSPLTGGGQTVLYPLNSP